MFRFQGTVSQDFLLQVFFHESFSTSLWNYHQDHFKCLQKFWRYSHVKVHQLYQWHRRYRCCCCYRRQIFRSEPSGNKSRSLVHQTANPQNLLYLRTFRMCGNLQICNLWTQYFLWFADPHFFANLKLLQSQNHFFLLTNTYLKCSNSKFYLKKILWNKPADDF